MGALDFLKEFEGRALDAASYRLLQRNYEMQDENNRLLKDKVKFLEGEIVRLNAEVQSLTMENEELSRRVKSEVIEQAFMVQDGIAFKRVKEGHFEENPYCPTCKVVMSNPSGLQFMCPKCKYFKRSQVTIRSLIARLNSSEK